MDRTVLPIAEPKPAPITTLDAELARALEPRAPRPDLRLAAVEQLAQAGISVGVFSNPVLPLITDSEESLEQVAAAAARAGAGCSAAARKRWRSPRR